MSYPQRLLNDHETVAVDLHPHWWYFATPTVALLAAISFGIATLIVTEADSNSRIAAGWLALAGIALSAFWVVVRYSRWTTTHFVITNQRVIFRSGFVAKSGIEIPLERVNTVHFNQGVLERLVGAGDLLIESGGESGQQRFTDISQPDRIQRAIHAQMDLRSGRTRAGSGADLDTNLDVATQLEKLEGMLDRGTLTSEEFAAQKQRLLGM
jgi:uncharacterized membrane protein YdbT with pleckstrin-like domain